MRQYITLIFAIITTTQAYSQANLGVRSGFYDAMPQAGLEFGINLSRDFILGVETSMSAADVKNIDGFNNYRYFDAYLGVASYNLAAKYFLTSSTYLKLKTGYRAHELYNTTFSGRNGGIVLTNKASSYVIGGAVGNTWRFRNGIYLGCEWIGYEQPVEQGLKETVLMASAGDKLNLSAKFNRKESELERLSRASAVSLLNLHLGISF